MAVSRNSKPSQVTPQAKPTKLLVTGTSGHLGANLVRRLLDDGHAIRVLLREGSDNSGVDGLDVERYYGDLRDAAAVDAAVRGCQRVYHAAAQVSTLYGDAALKRSIYDTNVVGTRHVLAACQQHECRARRRHRQLQCRRLRPQRALAAEHRGRCAFIPSSA